MDKTGNFLEKDINGYEVLHLNGKMQMCPFKQPTIMQVPVEKKQSVFVKDAPKYELQMQVNEWPCSDKCPLFSTEEIGENQRVVRISCGSEIKTFTLKK